MCHAGHVKKNHAVNTNRIVARENAFKRQLNDQDKTGDETPMAETNFHMYKCGGCGHKTIIDKYYKTRRVFCGVCGEKTRMHHQGECDVTQRPAPGGFSLQVEKHS